MSFDVCVLGANWLAFAEGLARTLLVCLVSIPIGFAVGTGLAFLQLYAARPVRALVTTYVEVVRNVPFLIQIFLLFFALPFFGVRLDAAAAGALALASYAAAYFSEIVRGAIATIPAGQSEAGRALGLSTASVFARILLPQVRSYIVPAGGNLAVTLVKESSVLSVVAVRELTYMSQDIIGRTFAPVEVFVLVALLYWALTATVAGAMDRIPWRRDHDSPDRRPAQ
jgi:His/Glu/Gln/Arg/opine family amino acid ABC transporter permease subunit